MNWLLIIVLILLAANIAWGIYRGFLRVVYSVVAWILILAVVTWATPFVTELLTKHTNIDEQIEAGCTKKLHELVQGSSGQERETKVPETEKDSSDGENTSGHQSENPLLRELEFPLPDVIAGKLLDTGEAADHLLDESGIYAQVAGRASNLAMRGISFVLVLLIVLLIFHILSTVVDLIAKLPVIGEVNRLLGGAAGFVKGILLVWLIFAFIAMGSATDIGMKLILQIYESDLLIALYENNLVLTILMIFL